MDFEQFFDSVYEQLVDIYEEQEFDDDVHELSHEEIESEHGLYGIASDDSANEDFANAVGAVTKYNIFTRVYTPQPGTNHSEES